MSFQRAALMVLGVHLMAIVLCSVAFRGAPRDVKVDFFFWGSILRREELSPSPIESSQPLELRSFRSGVRSNQPMMMAWARGLLADKPEMAMVPSMGQEPVPPKFSGPREVLQDEENMSVGSDGIDLPAPPNVRLRLPR